MHMLVTPMNIHDVVLQYDTLYPVFLQRSLVFKYSFKNVRSLKFLQNFISNYDLRLTFMRYFKAASFSVIMCLLHSVAISIHCFRKIIIHIFKMLLVHLRTHQLCGSHSIIYIWQVKSKLKGNYYLNLNSSHLQTLYCFGKIQIICAIW